MDAVVIVGLMLMLNLKTHSSVIVSMSEQMGHECRNVEMAAAKRDWCTWVTTPFFKTMTTAISVS